MYIEGFGLSGYRSFGKKLQKIGPCKKINFFIGKNNSGKSNVIRFISEHLKFLTEAISNNSSGLSLEFEDIYQTFDGTFQFAFACTIDNERYKILLDTFGDGHNLHSNISEAVCKFLELAPLTDESSLIWFTFEGANGGKFNVSDKIVEKCLKSFGIAEDLVYRKNPTGIGVDKWNLLVQHLALRPESNSLQHIHRWLARHLPQIVSRLSPSNLPLPDIHLIDAIREIKNDESLSSFDYNGRNIIEFLADLERPDSGPDYSEKRQKFDNLNNFLRDVLGKPDVSLQVPNSKNTINVSMDGKVLSIKNLGTGIHEIIILSIASTVLENQIVCIEEPEIHLHPLLQKKLIRYLYEQTTNQYFITTHSAALIDYPDAAIFHVTHNGNTSQIINAATNSEKFKICQDLGYRNSDLLQTNCLIWVEGPTDRLYLNHWINAKDPNLKEGIHYSIMFYGGRLLSHLSANDEEVDEFISLRRINQNSCIIIDSDKKVANGCKTEGRLNKTKQRVIKEFENGRGLAWVTAGREIENYVSADLVLSSIQKIKKDATKLASNGQFDKIYHYKAGTRATKEDIDKVKLAREIVKENADFSVYNLNEKVEDLVKFIKSCNDIK